MSSSFVSTHISCTTYSTQDLRKGLFVVLLHVNRVPPHIGIVINGKYHSLTIKGNEPDIELEVLLKTIQQKKIESVFLKIKPHPVFSIQHLNDVFLEILKKHPQITNHEVTCLSPLKEFFNEFYALNSDKNELIATFIQKLESNNFIIEAFSLNLEDNTKDLKLPVYSQDDLSKIITGIRDEFYN